MSTDIKSLEPQGALRAIVFEVTEADIAGARERCAAMTCTTAEGYEETRIAIGKLRGTRTAVEKRRVELKAEALDFGRRVDAAAKHLTALIENIEGPLREKRDVADAEKARLKREAEMAELLARDAELKAARDAEEARIKAEQEAAAATLAAETARLDAERAAFAEAQRKADEERAIADAAQADERAKLDADRLELEAKQKAIADAARLAEEAENRRLAGIQAEKDIAAKKERERIEAEQAAAAVVAERARFEAMKPEVQLLHEWAGRIRVFIAEGTPGFESPDVAAAATWGRGRILKIAEHLEAFQPGVQS